MNLRGRLLPDTSGKAEGFRLRDFQVDIANRKAICPAGRVAPRFVPAKPHPRNLVAFHVFFGKQCQRCPFFGPGLWTATLRGRHLGLSLHHDLIQTRRDAEQTDAFGQAMRICAGAESLISELVRGYGARRARYRGAHQVALQVAFTGAALNLKRLGPATFVSATSSANLYRITHFILPVFQQSPFPPHYIGVGFGLQHVNANPEVIVEDFSNAQYIGSLNTQLWNNYDRTYAVESLLREENGQIAFQFFPQVRNSYTTEALERLFKEMVSYT